MEKHTEKIKITQKPKFRPIITRIKLNPEQAVLSCCDQVSKGARGPNAFGADLACYQDYVNWTMTYTDCGARTANNSS